MTWAVMESPEMNGLEVGTLDFLIQGRMGGGVGANMEDSGMHMHARRNFSVFVVSFS